MCEHKLAPLNYYYDDDWGHKGHRVWDEKTYQDLTLCYCRKCGRVFVRPFDYEFKERDPMDGCGWVD